MLNDAAKKLVARYARVDAVTHKDDPAPYIEGAYNDALRSYEDLRELARRTDDLAEDVRSYYIAVFEEAWLKVAINV